IPERIIMKYLSHIDSPEDLKKLEIEELQPLVDEIRDYLIETIPSIGGHFASSLGVVELTVALHYLYDTPRDKIFWDVGHQGYVHKVLTGRRDAIKHIRQFGGISGFLKREESPYDVFGAGHASTSISAALGAAKARDILGKNCRVVAVTGDGSMTGGLSYEGLNNAGASNSDITVILNDNSMSISKNVGAISRYLVNMVSNPHYQKLRALVWDLTGKMPKSDTIRLLAKKLEESFKSFVIPGMLFEDLGFRYFGPVDGHDLNEVISVLKNIRDLKGPQILHLITTKGKGFDAAEEDPIKYHGIKAAKTSSVPAKPSLPAYLDVFGSSLVEIAEKDSEVVAVTAAMTEGTGLEGFREKFPKNFFDVGIAEGHAVTFSSALASEGLRPVAAIYSTFLQRAFDHVMHDAALQKLPVVFALDRAGLVGEDGPTHHGSLDLSYLSCIPGMIVSAPRNGRELRNLLYTGIYHDLAPFAIRYAKEPIPDADWLAPFEKIRIGSWELLKDGGDIAILAVGSMVERSLTAAEQLDDSGMKTSVVNVRFIKPFDEKMLVEILEKYDYIITVEENVLDGGFGSRIARYFIDNNIRSERLTTIGLPDNYITHGPRDKLLELTGLTPELLTERITDTVKNKKAARHFF
ncbi:1-deoxy-D-xylulose-5-phosphate synthase, partial [candidate division KSB1 bacterium]